MKQSSHLLWATVAVLALGVLTVDIRADENAISPGSSVRKSIPPQALPPAREDWTRAIPTPEESRAALLEPVSTQPSLGNEPTQSIPSPLATTGAAASGNTVATRSEPPPSGPTGAIGQTLPAKFSERNDILDRTPIMAFPMRLSDQDRQKILTAVMADKSSPAAGAEELMPMNQLTTEQALNEMHPLPESLRGIAQVQRFKYVKAKDKVLLVEPSTRTVVDQIKS